MQRQESIPGTNRGDPKARKAGTELGHRPAAVCTLVAALPQMGIELGLGGGRSRPAGALTVGPLQEDTVFSRLI